MKPMIIAMAALAMAGCSTTRYVAVPSASVTTDSIRTSVNRTDTVFVTDSTIIDHSADTVRINRQRTVWRSICRTDTLWRTHTDTVRISVPVPTGATEAVEPLRWWHKLLAAVGAVAFLIMAYTANPKRRR